MATTTARFKKFQPLGQSSRGQRTTTKEKKVLGGLRSFGLRSRFQENPDAFRAGTKRKRRTLAVFCAQPDDATAATESSSPKMRVLHAMLAALSHDPNERAVVVGSLAELDEVSRACAAERWSSSRDHDAFCRLLTNAPLHAPRVVLLDPRKPATGDATYVLVSENTLDERLLRAHYDTANARAATDVLLQSLARDVPISHILSLRKRVAARIDSNPNVANEIEVLPPESERSTDSKQVPEYDSDQPGEGDKVPSDDEDDPPPLKRTKGIISVESLERRPRQRSIPVLDLCFSSSDDDDVDDEDTTGLVPVVEPKKIQGVNDVSEEDDSSGDKKLESHQAEDDEEPPANSCPKCTFSNAPTARSCEMCGTRLRWAKNRPPPRAAGRR